MRVMPWERSGRYSPGPGMVKLLEKWFYQELRPLMAICSLNPPGNLAIVSDQTKMVEAQLGIARTINSIKDDDWTKDESDKVTIAKKMWYIGAESNLQVAMKYFCSLLSPDPNDPAMASTISQDSGRVHMQYGLPDVGPSMKLDSTGITLLAGDPDGVMTLRAGPELVGPRIELNPQTGITLSAGDPEVGSSITLNPETGITFRFGEYKLTINEEGITMEVGESSRSPV